MYKNFKTEYDGDVDEHRTQIKGIIFQSRRSVGDGYSISFSFRYHYRLCLLDDELELDVLDVLSLSRRLSSSPRLRLFIGLRGSFTSFEYQSSFFVDASLAKTSPCSSNRSVCVSHVSLFRSSSSSTTAFFVASDVDASGTSLRIFASFDLKFFSNWSVNCSLQ